VSEMPGPVLVVAQSSASGPPRATLEALSAGRAAQAALGVPLHCALLGIGARNLAVTALASGCEQAYVGESADLDAHWGSVATSALVELVSRTRPAVVILSDSEQGQEMAARLSVRLDVGCAPHCVQVRLEEGRLVADRRIHGGRFVETVVWERMPCLLTVAAGVFAPVVLPAMDMAGAPSGAIVDLSVEELAAGEARRVAVTPRLGARPDIAEAQVIVSVGRGIGGPEKIPLFEGLADTLGAGLAASRAVVDAGWLDHSHQVGQTGRSVAPQVYIACAISGAVQHLVGIAAARHILAINTDPEAPIFQVADVGIVGDALDIVPKITAALERP
jgi:electron transfer flavoprotein alpha subunit